MSIVAPPPQVRMVVVQRARVLSTQCVLLCGAMLLPTACYSGLSDVPEPWDNTNAGTEAEDTDSEADGDGDGDADGDADGGADNGDADPDGGDAGDATDAGDEGSTEGDGGSADPTSADGGSADPTSADGGSADTGSADGASADSGSADGGSADGGADGGGADEVPDNEFCMDVAGSDPAWSDLEEEILVIVNQRRSEGANCGSAGSFGATGPLTMNPALRCAARVHSKQMVTENFFDHTTPWGESPWDRMAAAGYSYSTAGENIAAGNSTAASTMQQWMDSDGHCSNIMSPDFTEIGVGYYPGGGYGHYWTQNFGSP